LKNIAMVAIIFEQVDLVIFLYEQKFLCKFLNANVISDNLSKFSIAMDFFSSLLSSLM